jgi:DNA polymerase III gamma/tau subunit
LQKIYDRLKLIADTEGVKIDEKALREVARAGEGSMRDAQSAFDQVISFSGESIVTEDVTNALGIASTEILTKIVVAISEKKAEESLKAVEELIHRGQDLRNFCRDLLSLFRDMLVAKVSDSATLLDSAILSREDLLKFADSFSESDLIRFFNSLSDTETKLRNAALPRYILEIGLVKLIEMLRVTPIEKILERLAQLENSDSINASTEKKTLKINETPRIEVSKPEVPSRIIDVKPSEVPFPIEKPTIITPIKEESNDLPKFEIDDNYRSFEEDFSPEDDAESENEEVVEIAAVDRNSSDFLKKAKENYLANITVRLPPISSEDLEHAEDAKLDSAFEDRLVREGETLTTIRNATEIISKALESNGLSENSENNSSLQSKRVSEKINFEMPDFNTTEISNVVPILPENPNEEDLWKFANSHPVVNRALKIFRGKIVKVEKLQG